MTKIEPKKCPKCELGTLEELSKDERLNLQLKVGRHIPHGTIGCDECKHYE